MAVIEVEGLHKEYRRLRGGRTLAVDGLDLSVPEGGVFGFLGPIGAGKTTTIRCLLGLVRATRGSCHLLGGHVRRSPYRQSSAEYHGILGGMTDTAKIAISLPEQLLDVIDVERRARGLSRSEFFRRAVEDLLRKEAERDAIDQYTQGYRDLPEDPEDVEWASQVASTTLASEPWE
jgi:ABC-type glutathione transport system ATPase component